MSLPPVDLTVVIPTYNNAAYLTEAVESVRRQSRPPRRIVIIDDGSTDATPETVATLRNNGEGPPIDYLRQDNAGPAAAINRGAALVDSTLIAFQSADDIWVPEKIAWQLRALEDGADLVFGYMQNFVSPELDPATAANLQCPPEPMIGHNAGTVLLRLDIFHKIGPFNESFRIGEFMDWYGRAVDLGLKSAMLPQVVSMRRLHGRNHSLTRKAAGTGYAHVLKAMLDRRRSQSGQS
jgi:glycosyltransferase involved in cell wall biosynthesis